jgi:hypothetical protein
MTISLYFYNRIARTCTCLFVPHRKHITSRLLAQQVNAICRFGPEPFVFSSDVKNLKIRI